MTPPPAPTMTSIVDAVCESIGLRPSLVWASTPTRGNGKNDPIVIARQLACLLGRELTPLTYVMIAAGTGYRTGQSAVLAVRRAQERVRGDEPLLAVGDGRLSLTTTRAVLGGARRILAARGLRGEGAAA